MKNISLRDRRKPASEVAAELREASDKQISNRKVRARMVEAGLKGCKARKKPYLSEVNRKNGSCGQKSIRIGLMEIRRRSFGLMKAILK